MDHRLQRLGEELQAGRERAGLSQRALSRLSGVPQAQISRIEAGFVDLRATSLISLAGAASMQVVLVPATALNAVEAVIRNHRLPADQHIPQRPAYHLDDEPEEDEAYPGPGVF